MTLKIYGFALSLMAYAVVHAAPRQSSESDFARRPIDFPGNRDSLLMEDLRSADVQAFAMPIGSWSKKLVVDAHNESRLVAQHRFQIVSGDLKGQSVNVILSGADTGQAQSRFLNLDPHATYLLLANQAKEGLLGFPFYGYHVTPRRPVFQIAGSSSDLSGIAIFRVEDSRWPEESDRANRILDVLTGEGKSLSHWDIERRVNLLDHLLTYSPLKPTIQESRDEQWVRTHLADRMLAFGDTLAPVERASFYAVAVNWRMPHSEERFLNVLLSAARSDPNAFSDEDGIGTLNLANLSGWTPDNREGKVALGHSLVVILADSGNSILKRYCIHQLPGIGTSPEIERAVFAHLEDPDPMVRDEVLNHLAYMMNRPDLLPVKQGNLEEQARLIHIWKAIGGRQP